MLLLRSVGTHLSLLLKEDRDLAKESPGQNCCHNRRARRQIRRAKSDDDFHARKRTQLPQRSAYRRVSADGRSMGEDHYRRGFFPSLSRTAFTRAVFQSNVFLPKLNAMRIPVSFHTALKTAELPAFLDSGATKCFVSQQFIDTHKLGT